MVKLTDCRQAVPFLRQNYQYGILGYFSTTIPFTLFVDNADSIQGVVLRVGKDDLYVYSKNTAFLDEVYTKFIKGRKAWLNATEVGNADYLFGKVKRYVCFSRCTAYAYDGKDIVVRPLPEGYTLGKIRREYYGCVVEHHQYYGTLKEVRYCATHFPTVAVYKDDVMVSWAMVHENGSIGPLYTLPDYRGKRLADTVISSLQLLMLERGLQPYSYIVKGNSASENMISRVNTVALPLDVCWGSLEDDND